MRSRRSSADLSLIPLAGVGAALVQRATVHREDLQAGFALGIMTRGWVARPHACRRDGHRRADLRRAYRRAGSPLSAALPGGGRDYDVVGRPAAPSGLPPSECPRRHEFVGPRERHRSRMAVAGLGGVALVLGALAGALATSVLTWTWAPPPLPRLAKGPTRELWRFGLPASLTAMSWIGFRNCDYAIVGARRGALQAGLYYRAYTLGVEYQKKVSQVMTLGGLSRCCPERRTAARWRTSERRLCAS